jgi:alpha-glucoside transport system substrate-binding protein
MRGFTVLLGGLLAVTAVAACGERATTVGAEADCSAFAPYGNNSRGERVVIAASIRGIEAQRFVDVLTPFERCTGIDVVWQGSAQFEQSLQEAAKKRSGLPDLAALPQPGLLKTLVTQGVVHEASEQVRTAAEHDYPEAWLRYGTVDRKFYAAPLGANVKSLVWYSPKLFIAHQWKAPKTWQEMLDLSGQIVKDAKIRPWCAGIQAGAATGWPLTDWVEDLVLRQQPAGMQPGELYDQWVSHKIPFSDPRIVAAIDEVGQILRNPKWVNGGYGDVQSIVQTSWEDGGLPIVDSGECALYKMASFYSNNWPPGTLIGPEYSNDVYAFPFPSMDGKTQPLVVAGEFLAAFNDREATQAVQAFMSSGDFVNAKARKGDWVSPNRRLDLANVSNRVDQLTVQLLNTPNALLRFDGGDMMPAAVGTGSFWSEMSGWLSDPRRPTLEVCRRIDRTWPS